MAPVSTAMSARARCRLARSRYSRVAYVTTPASSPMMTTTIMTSMREKARGARHEGTEARRHEGSGRCPSFSFVPPCLSACVPSSLNRIACLQDGEHGREDDEQDDQREDDDQHGLENRGEALRAGGDLLVVR